MHAFQTQFELKYIRFETNVFQIETRIFAHLASKNEASQCCSSLETHNFGTRSNYPRNEIKIEASRMGPQAVNHSFLDLATRGLIILELARTALEAKPKLKPAEWAPKLWNPKAITPRHWDSKSDQNFLRAPGTPKT